MINTMRDVAEKKKKQSVAVLTGLAVLLFIVLVPGRAWYRGYIAEQQAKTCRRARLSMLQVYERLLAEEEAEGRDGTADEIAGESGDMMAAAERAAERFRKCKPAGSPDAYDVAVQGLFSDPDLVCAGPCLGQGTYTILLDASDPENPEKMRIICSVHGDEVTLDQ